MRKFYFNLVCLTFLLISSGSLLAQNSEIDTKYGVYGGINYNVQIAEFKKLPGIPDCCPIFGNGDGMGFNIGVLYEHKLDDKFWLAGRLGIMTLDGQLIKDESIGVILNTGYVDGSIEHKIDSKIMNFGFEPSIMYTPIDKLYVSGGLRLGLNLTKTVDKVETLKSPAGSGTYVDSLGNDTHSRTRNAFNGDIPNAISFQAAIVGGVSYELPLNKQGNLTISPELSYYMPLTKLVENTDWKVSPIKLGVAIKYGKMPPIVKKEIFRKDSKIDTVKIESPAIAQNMFKLGKDVVVNSSVETESEIITTETLTRVDSVFIAKIFNLSGSITAFGLDKDGNEIPNPIFKIEEFISNRLDPLLNYVFFEENSSDLPGRYKLISSVQTNSFELNQLFKESTFDIYHNLLNIVGKRLTVNPSANLTLVGCNSNNGEEKGATDLSQKRAETIKVYLTKVWNIADNRIKIEKRNLPEKVSTPKDDEEKSAENRRVEIYSDDSKILEPIFIEKIDRLSNPPFVRFKPTANAEAGLTKWTINASQKSDPSRSFTQSGESELPSVVDWELGKSQITIPKSAEPLFYSLNLEDAKGNKKVIDNQTLPFQVISVQKKRTERIGDYEIERFSLILFDFDKANIEGSNKKIIDFISGRIKPESEIEIKGYTDRTGDSDYNKKLSEKRVDATRNALKRQDSKVEAVGEDMLLYNNDIPEGRFYCRTVEILVKTKVK